MPMSSPIQKTLGSDSISSQSPCRIASKYVARGMIGFCWLSSSCLYCWSYLQFLDFNPKHICTNGVDNAFGQLNEQPIRVIYILPLYWHRTFRVGLCSERKNEFLIYIK